MPEGPPLIWEGSASTNPTISDQLPDEVITCLQNARFLHLATCTSNRPHVSLMNYTYLPAPSPQPPHQDQNQHQHQESTHHPRLPPGPLIIMTSNPSSKKTLNLQQNPAVSLLVHDWVSSRPPNISSSGERERSPVGGRSSSLANMLMQLNSAAVSSISATINGEATVLGHGTEEERWCKERHLAANTFEAGGGTEVAQQSLFGTSPGVREREAERSGDGGRNSYIEDSGVRVVVVRIRDGRISDWKGGVKDFCLADAGAGGEREGDGGSGGGSLVNGVRGGEAT